MQEPFPELADLTINAFLTTEGIPDQIPDSFLGGSAPRLRKLTLGGIPFPGLPKLLLSTTHLVTLCLWRIPHSGYVSPEAMVTGLSVLTSLEDFTLHYRLFKSNESPYREDQCPSLPSRTVLPVLTALSLQGVTDYLEDLVARIDAPRLFHLSITFYGDQIIDFDNPHLVQFLSRTPSFETPEKAHSIFNDRVARVELSSETSGCGTFDVGIDSTRQLVAPFPTLAVEKLCRSDTGVLRSSWRSDIFGGRAQWLELFRQ